MRPPFARLLALTAAGAASIALAGCGGDRRASVTTARTSTVAPVTVTQPPRRGPVLARAEYAARAAAIYCAASDSLDDDVFDPTAAERSDEERNAAADVLSHHGDVWIRASAELRALRPAREVRADAAVLAQSLHDTGEMTRETAEIFRNEDHHLMTEMNERDEAVTSAGQRAALRLGIVGCPD